MRVGDAAAAARGEMNPPDPAAAGSQPAAFLGDAFSIFLDLVLWDFLTGRLPSDSKVGIAMPHQALPDLWSPKEWFTFVRFHHFRQVRTLFSFSWIPQTNRRFFLFSGDFPQNPSSLVKRLL